MSIGISKLAGMPQGHREKLENCVRLLLLWVAASHQDIQTAYENLASIFEVGRVEAMGEAAVSLAHSRFKKIQQAYWLLKGAAK